MLADIHLLPHLLHVYLAEKAQRHYSGSQMFKQQCVAYVCLCVWLQPLSPLLFIPKETCGLRRAVVILILPILEGFRGWGETDLLITVTAEAWTLLNCLVSWELLVQWCSWVEGHSAGECYMLHLTSWAVSGKWNCLDEFGSSADLRSTHYPFSLPFHVTGKLAND